MLLIQYSRFWRLLRFIEHSWTTSIYACMWGCCDSKLLGVMASWSVWSACSVLRNVETELRSTGLTQSVEICRNILRSSVKSMSSMDAWEERPQALPQSRILGLQDMSNIQVQYFFVIQLDSNISQSQYIRIRQTEFFVVARNDAATLTCTLPETNSSAGFDQVIATLNISQDGQVSGNVRYIIYI